MGNDAIFVGGTINDLIFGNQGNDLIVDTVGGAGDTIAAGLGDDTVVYVGGTVYGNEGSNTISVEGGGNDTIFGGNTSVDAAGNGDGSNFIDLRGVASVTGGARSPSELVFGGSGNDNILFGATIDAVTVTGDGGQNVYGFTSVAGVAASVGGSGSGQDVITDFLSGTDKFAINSVVGATSGDYIPTGVTNYGTTVMGTTLQQAAANAIAGAESANGNNAATFKFGSDFYMVADVNGAAGFTSASDVLVDIKGTSALTRNDFI